MEEFFYAIIGIIFGIFVLYGLLNIMSLFINDSENKKDEIPNKPNIIKKISMFFGGALLIFGVYSCISTGGNSNNGSGICGKYNTFYGGAFSGGWITTFDGFTIYIEFPNEYIDKEWSKYDKQNICISGNIVRTPQQGNQPDVYTIYNPYFKGYAN